MEVWDSSVGFIRPWVLKLQLLAFVVWFSRILNQLRNGMGGDTGIVVFVWDKYSRACWCQGCRAWWGGQDLIPKLEKFPPRLSAANKQRQWSCRHCNVRPGLVKRV
ncbi:hypothetical protein Lal_00015832 [Lupinus albus]|nr:hypothetical protein Lal_00015832 [Lupinus albus]